MHALSPLLKLFLIFIMIMHTFNYLYTQPYEKCPICFEHKSLIYLQCHNTHKYCNSCIGDIFKLYNKKCPLCFKPAQLNFFQALKESDRHSNKKSLIASALFFGGLAKASANIFMPQYNNLLAPKQCVDANLVDLCNVITIVAPLVSLGFYLVNTSNRVCETWYLPKYRRT